MPSDHDVDSDFDFTNIAEAFKPDQKRTFADDDVIQLAKYEGNSTLSGQRSTDCNPASPLKCEPIANSVSKSMPKLNSKTASATNTTNKVNKPALTTTADSVLKKTHITTRTPSAAVLPPSQRDLTAVTAMLERLQEHSTLSRQRLHEVVLSKYYRGDIFGRQNTDECITVSCPWCGELKGFRYLSKHLFAKCASRNQFLNQSALKSATRSTRSTRNKKQVNYASQSNANGADVEEEENEMTDAKIETEEEEFEVELILDEDDDESEEEEESVTRKRKSLDQQHWDDEYTPSKRHKKRNH